MENANELRGATWVAFLLDKGGYKSLADMHAALNVVGSVQLWSTYKAGKASPQETTVKLVDRAVPGSASLWFNGPGGLPLWAVLEGDIAVCQRLIADVLNDYLEPEPWMSLARRPVASMGDSERLKALLEIVLPQSHWQDARSSVRYNPNAPRKLELVGWLSLVELFARDENPLAISYPEDRLKAIQENVIKSFVFSFVNENSKNLGVPVEPHAVAHKPTCNLTDPAYVLAFIALIQVCNESRDKTLMNAPDFLKLGIHKAVIDSFSLPVAQFVQDL